MNIGGGCDISVDMWVQSSSSSHNWVYTSKSTKNRILAVQKDEQWGLELVTCDIQQDFIVIIEK